MTTPRGNEKQDHVRALRNEGKSVAEIAEVVGVSKPTVYNYLKGAAPKRATARKLKPRLEVSTGDMTPTFTVTPDGENRVVVSVRLVTDTKSASIFLRKILA